MATVTLWVTGAITFDAVPAPAVADIVGSAPQLGDGSDATYSTISSVEDSLGVERSTRLRGPLETMPPGSVVSIRPTFRASAPSGEVAGVFDDASERHFSLALTAPGSTWLLPSLAGGVIDFQHHILADDTIRTQPPSDELDVAWWGAPGLANIGAALAAGADMTAGVVIATGPPYPIERTATLYELGLIVTLGLSTKPRARIFPRDDMGRIYPTPTAVQSPGRIYPGYQ